MRNFRNPVNFFSLHTVNCLTGDRTLRCELSSQQLSLYCAPLLSKVSGSMAHQQLSGESQLSGLDHCTIDSLPEEVLARVLSLLQPCQLHWVERVNKRLRNAVVQHDLWRMHCNRSCTNFQAAVLGCDTESLRQVLTELRRLSDAQSDAQSPCSTATSAKPIRLVPFPSEPRSGSSPLLQSDEQLRRHSPKARLAPFWGPGLTPADPTSVPSNSPHSSSILSRLQRLCSGERNLRTTASRDNDEASGSSNSSSSSKLWHFDLCMSEDVLRSMFYKRLCWRLGACSAKESLIAEAIQASSTDNDEERIQNVLQPSARMRGFFNACYWSSGPSNEVDSSEALDFKLAHPVCVVHEVHLQPFKAYFQPGQPLYPSKSVRFHFASSLQQLEGATGENSSSCTAEYPVENSDSLQRFIIPPMLCIGGFVRVELIGRVQRQREDNRYYTCICYVKIVGTPVYGFLPSPTQPSRSLDVQPCESACMSRDNELYNSVEHEISCLPFSESRCIQNLQNLYTSSADKESSDSAATMAAAYSANGKGDSLECSLNVCSVLCIS
ncbi:TPA: hypothetical protein ACH3X2_007930 [Trebouxia sp. C0005]